MSAKAKPKISKAFEEFLKREHPILYKLLSPYLEDEAAHDVFHYFPRLPIEIRLKIWRLNAPEPCVITQAEPLTGYKPLHTIMVSRPTPAVLHACSESRNQWICKNNAPVSLDADCARYHPLFEDREGKKIFFSLEVDALHLMDTKVAEPLIRKELKFLVLADTGNLPTPNTKLADFLSTEKKLFLDRHDDEFSAPDYFKLKLFKNLEVLVVTGHQYGLAKLQWKAERALEVIQSYRPDFKRPLVVCKVINKESCDCGRA